MADDVSDAFTYALSLRYGNARKNILCMGKRGNYIKILTVYVSDDESPLFSSPQFLTINIIWLY